MIRAERYDRRLRSARLAVIAAAAVTAAVAGVALVGWVLDAPALYEFGSSDSSTKVNTALCLLLTAVSLILLAQGDPAPRLRQGLAWATVAIGALTIAQYLFDIDLGIDELLFDDPGLSASPDGRPSEQTAVAFVLLGLSLALSTYPRAQAVRDFSTLIVGIAGGVALAGHLSDFSETEQVRQMAPVTAAGLMLLGSACAMLPRRHGLSGIVWRDDSGGRLLRLLLPLTILLPLSGALFLGITSTNGMVDGTGLLATLVVVTTIFVLLLARLADDLHHRDTERTRLITELDRGKIQLTEQAEELSRLNEDLGRSNRDLEQFASVASHDLREPLLVIEGFSNLLERRYGDQFDEQGGRFIENIGLGVDRMQKMIDGLLEFSRMGNKTLDLSRTPVADLVQEARDQLSETIRRSEAVIEVGELPEVECEPTTIAIVFQNLIANAIKYTDGRIPEIRIGAEERAGSWLIEVADNGVGIDPKFATSAFDIFRRLHPASVSGAGIGLSTCRRIIERHGGEIWVDPGPDGGSVFRFTLPKEPTVTEPAGAVEPS